MLGARKSLALLSLFFICEMDASEQTNRLGRVTVVLAPPPSSHPYYASSYDAIVNFTIVFATKIIKAKKDNVVVLVDRKTRDIIGERLPQDVLFNAHVEDIWLRDFSPVGLNSRVLFDYRPSYLNPNVAHFIQRSLTTTLSICSNADFHSSNLVLDGGNVVENFIDSAIITDRVLQDNPNMLQSMIEEELRFKLRCSRIVIIPSEPKDTTGHADGMVAFLDEKTLAVSPPSSAIQAKLWRELRRAFEDDTVFVPLNSVYKDEKWRGFSSACGLHINLLTTDDVLYVPTFGTDAENRKRGQSPAKDAEVLEQIRQAISSNKNKTVVEVPVPYAICRMGGSVRCLSWAAKGDVADRLVENARTGTC